MNAVMNASFILGLAAITGTAASPATNDATIAANPSPCEWQVVKAKPDTVWTNILEGGPVRAIVSAASHAKTYRDVVCANPDADWPSYRQIEVESISIAASNLKRPLSGRQVNLLKAALSKNLSKQFGEAESTGRTLKVRVTVSEVRRTLALLNIFTLAAIQAPVSFGGATAHFELIDGTDGGKVADVTLRGSGRLYEILPSVTTLGDSKSVLARATKQLGKEIEMLRQTHGTAAEVAASDGNR
jgi:hypothetical protein